MKRFSVRHAALTLGAAVAIALGTGVVPSAPGRATAAYAAELASGGGGGSPPGGAVRNMAGNHSVQNMGGNHGIHNMGGQGGQQSGNQPSGQGGNHQGGTNNGGNHNGGNHNGHGDMGRHHNWLGHHHLHHSSYYVPFFVNVPVVQQVYYGPYFDYDWDWYYYRHILYPDLFVVYYVEPVVECTSYYYFFDGAYYCYAVA